MFSTETFPTNSNRLFAMINALLCQLGRNLRRTWPTQIMGLLTVLLAVLIFAFFLLIQLNLQAAGARFGQDIRLTVYFESEPEAAQLATFKQQIRQFAETAEVNFISSRQAYQRFAQRLGDERDILEGLTEDFLPPALEVIPASGRLAPEQLEQLAAMLLALPGANKVQYGREWLQRFHAVKRLLITVVLVSGALLVLNMVFTISHTTRLTLNTRREEIEILHLLGARRNYIRLPLLAEGLLQGGLGSALGLAALYLLFHQAGELGLLPALAGSTFLPLPTLATIWLGATLTCLLAGLLAINKALRV